QPLHTGMARHPHHPPFVFSLTKQHGEWGYPDGISASAEMIAMGGHVGTHIDALGHIACDGLIHGGHRIADHQSYDGGLEIGSVEEVPPLLCRGHLVDAEELFGRELTPADGIGDAELARWFERHDAP